jgi:hypothetical protein
MARIRYLKPDFFTDEDIGKLSFEVRLLYQGLWVNADKEGRLEDRPQSLKTKIFPYDEVDIEAGLKRLEEIKAYSNQPFIHRYTSEGFRYIQIINWHKHQKPHHTEKCSEIPEPPTLPLFTEKTKKHINNKSLNNNLNIKSSLNLNQLEASTELNNSYITVKEPLSTSTITEKIIKSWEKLNLPKDKKQIVPSEILAIERVISGLMLDTKEPIPESELLIAIENYGKALSLPNSQSYPHKLYNFLQKHVKKYVSWAFDINAHDKDFFEDKKNQKQFKENINGNVSNNRSNITGEPTVEFIR